MDRIAITGCGGSGREKLHYLNPVPIRLIHDRWIDKYTEGPASLLANIKHVETLAAVFGAPSSRSCVRVSWPGWMFVLSGLKTLLETGSPLAES